MSRRYVRAILPTAMLVAATGAQASPGGTLHRIDAGDADAISVFGNTAAPDPFAKPPRALPGQHDLSVLAQGFGAPPVDAAARPQPRPAKAKRSGIAHLPEPATWAMLIVGFGAIGALVRRRLRRSDAAFEARLRRIANGEEV